ncbi:uncharacterized protein PRCAT00002849001 [Priceomyces carsonii]|uniref:uncharacterized protein n=1 Tax=Priceomyces carsonii TaxID=28549 RepID=UPI002ED7877F|nr:unnamed protein product [Priceomyces carsonii]
MVRRYSSVSADFQSRNKRLEEGNSGAKSSWRWFDLVKSAPAVQSLASRTENTKKKSKELEEKETIVGCCHCCGIVLTYPSDAGKYRCSVCNTTNMLASLESVLKLRLASQKGDDFPHVLSYRYVKKLVDNCLDNANTLTEDGQPKSTHEIFEPLLNYLLGAFKSIECLNNSFKINKRSTHLHYSKFNLNREDIRATFELLSKLPTRRPLYYSLTSASESLKRVYITSNSPKDLIWILVLFEIPFLSRALVNNHNSIVDDPEIKNLCYDILKRCLGLMANLGCTVADNYITSWFSLLTGDEFIQKVDLINLYITFQLKRYYYIANNPELLRRRSTSAVPSSSNRGHPSDNEYIESLRIKDELQLVPEGRSSIFNIPVAESIGTSLPLRTSSKKRNDSKIKVHQYGGDWHIKSASIVLLAFLRANSIRHEKVPIHTFYNSLVDFVNIKMDFDSWQSTKKTSKTSPAKSQSNVPEIQTVIEYIHGVSQFDSSSYFFCLYPFLVSLGAKISVLEYEARRQMERKAEEAFINSLDRKVAIDVYFKVKVRRDFIVQDSLRAIQLNQQNLKKSLRVQFIDEPGIDAGGLKKEWFLLLSRALFSPQAGMLSCIEGSNLLWFNIVPIDNSEMYYLFGVVLGLAIYNSTILDLNLPMALYKLLLGKTVNFEDYKQIFPDSASNLNKLRDFDDDTLSELDLTFEVTYSNLFGRNYTQELILNGSNVTVTAANRDKYIERYSQFFLWDGIIRQALTFVRGFNNVVGGNALSLFLPEEINLLICGSSETRIDIDILMSVTKYIGWPNRNEAIASPLVQWFWEILRSASFSYHKKFLIFVTGSDRVPATGLQNLTFRLSRIGKDSNKLPIAHTCFNELALFDYSSKLKLTTKLNVAVYESSGFGIK